jgi:hypothetical protein
MTLSRTARLSVGVTLLLLASSALTMLAIWLLFPGLAGAVSSNGNSGYLRRYAANFTAYGFEIATNTPPAANGLGGTIIYNKNFFTADDINTLYVTVSTTGDDHGGARLQMSCRVDGNPCNPGANPVGGAPSGWITLQRHDNYNDNYVGPGYGGDGGGGAGDMHDNSINKVWCTPFETKAGTHNVQIRMASSPVPGDPTSAGNVVFIEGADFQIDGARVADDSGRCTNQVLDPSVATSPSATIDPVTGAITDTTTFVPLVGETSVDTAPLAAGH